MTLVSSTLLVSIAICLSAAAPPPPLPLQAVAQPAPPSFERMQLARQFVAKTISPDKFMDTIRASAASQMDQLECGCNSDSKPTSTKDAATAAVDTDKDLDHFLALVEPKIRERLPNLMEAYAQVYAREFSADELKQMLSFADSPAGRHYLSNRFDVETDKAVLIQQEGFWLDLVPAMEQLQKQKCQEHAAQRIAMGDKTAKCALSGKPDTSAG